MIRLIALILVVVGLSGCGNTCTRIAGAEQGADDKGSPCNSSRQAWSTSKVQSCENNLANCTQNDLRQLDLYAGCLNALPRCAEGQSTSWAIQRGSCGVENLLGKVSLQCLSGL
jgi:uncharacterized protein YceK